MEVNILGTNYQIITGVDYNKDLEMKDLDGYIKYYTKEIHIVDLRTVSDSWKTASEKEVAVMTKNILRHEIVHGFLFESGLSASSTEISEGWAENEELVDWIALQVPKMIEAFRQADCL